MTKKKKKSETILRGVLFYLNGPNEGKGIKLRRDATIFGRDKGDILLVDSEISATHCQIQNINDTYHIFDMNSTNGTYVNGQRIIKSKLNQGDIINIGKTSLRFSLESENKVRHISTAYHPATTNNSGETSSELKPAIMNTIMQQDLKKTKSSSVELHVQYYDGSNEVIKLNQNVIYIGRSSSFGKFDQDPEISRKHMLIKLNDSGDIFIEDLGSTNGSFLNAVKIQGMTKVNQDDTVKVGTSLLQIKRCS